MNSKNILIYTDGACSGNPGPGGYGSIITDFTSVTELGQYYPQTTNNRMEMQAVLSALNFVLQTYKSVGQIQIFTDSVYVIRGSTQWLFGWKKRGWKTADNKEVTNQDLWQSMDQLLYQITTKYSLKIKWSFIRGHKGIAGNERCDEIGVAFSKRQDIQLFSGDAKSYYFDVIDIPIEEALPDMKSHSKTDSTEKKQTWYLSLINNQVAKYTTWKDCEAAVKGRPGVKFKKVTSSAEEDALLKSWGKS
jgi:ribonuclease HI